VRKALVSGGCPHNQYVKFETYHCIGDASNRARKAKPMRYLIHDKIKRRPSKLTSNKEAAQRVWNCGWDWIRHDSVDARPSAVYDYGRTKIAGDFVGWLEEERITTVGSFPRFDLSATKTSFTEKSRLTRRKPLRQSTPV
jgi:hypothetical protein